MQLVWNLKDRLFLESFIAGHLQDLTKRTKGLMESGFYDITEDVPYVASVIADGHTAVGFNQNKPAYWHIEPMTLIASNFDRLEPILAREIADGAVVNLAICARMPNMFAHEHGVSQVSYLYERTALVYPDHDIRPKLRSMSENFCVWVKVLPFFYREVSLLL